jgi:hypothetical protein
MNPAKTRRTAVIAAYIVTVLVNGLANALPINGQNTGEISDRFPIYFVPAGWTFAIWLPIYLGLGAYVIYQAQAERGANLRLRSIAWPFVTSCALNVAWIFLWHYNVFVATLPVMVGLLLCLILIYRRLDIGLYDAAPDFFWLVQVPFSVYLGWITVATIANASQVLYYLGWSGWGLAPETWTVIMLAVATAVGGLVAFRRRDLFFLVVLIWAFVGIAFGQQGAPVVVAAAWIAAIVTFGFTMYALVSHALRPAGATVQPRHK